MMIDDDLHARPDAREDRRDPGALRVSHARREAADRRTFEPDGEPLDLAGLRAAPAATRRCAKRSQDDARRRSREQVKDVRTCAAAAARASRPGMKWSFVPMGDGRAAPQVPGRQRRRDGAGHVQGPAAAGGRPAPADRRHDPRRATPSRPTSPTSSCAANTALAAERLRQRHRRGLRGRLPRARTSWAPATASSAPAHAAPAATCAARRPALLNALEGKRANPARQAAVSAGRGPVGQADRRQQRRDPLQRAAHRRQRRRVVHGLSLHRGRRHQALRRQRQGQAPRRLGAADGHPAARDPRGARRRHARRLRFRGAAARRRLHRLPASRSTSTSPMDFDSVAEGRQPPGHRHHDRARRPDLPGRHGAATSSTSSPRNPAAGARPAARGCPGSSSMLEAIEEGRGRAEDLDILDEHMHVCWARATPSAPWRPARWSRCRAR